MALPTIIPPPNAGDFLIEGQAIEENAPYSRVEYASGHSRQRRCYTEAERTVSVSWFLEASALAELNDWYEDSLAAGSRQFAALVRNQGVGDRWWTARWVEFSVQMFDQNAGLVSGRIFLIGDESETGPTLGTLSGEITVPLVTAATPTIPNTLSGEITVPLTAVYFGSP